MYQWFNTYTHFSCTLKTIVGFPFSLVLSISYLDHFRGISSRRSPSISPLLVNEKVVDHFFEIDDKKRKRRRGGKRSGESISGLKTRSARFISKPVSLLSAPVFRVGWWRSLTLLYRQGKNPGRIYLPSSISNTGVQYLEVERRGGKKWRTSGTIDFSLLNFVFVGTLVKVETSFSKLIYLPSSCRLFLNDFFLWFWKALLKKILLKLWF